MELTTEDKLTEFSKQVKENYDSIDIQPHLHLDLDLEKINWILNVGFGITYHKAVSVSSDSRSIRLKLEKI